jgi:dynein heavy chain
VSLALECTLIYLGHKTYTW